VTRRIVIRPAEDEAPDDDDLPTPVRVARASVDRDWTESAGRIAVGRDTR
jgi:hypothetical protein